MNEEIIRIYQAINAVSERVNDLAKRMEDNYTAKIEEVTPYTETKTAYYGESEKVFYNVPNGNITVFFDNYNGSYTVSRLDGTVTVSFDALKNDTNITIMIQ